MRRISLFQNSGRVGGKVLFPLVKFLALAEKALLHPQAGALSGQKGQKGLPPLGVGLRRDHAAAAVHHRQTGGVKALPPGVVGPLVKTGPRQLAPLQDAVGGVPQPQIVPGENADTAPAHFKM